MIKRLTFSVVFKNGRNLKGDHDFGPGLTALVGRNGRGKSLRLEMIRYALFGSEALRGTADDYGSVVAQLWFEVGGVRYSVERSSRAAMIARGEDVLATGHKAVTAKVRSILGFGLDVFDVACSVNQGEVERLSSMRAADRKRMVDSTIGLDVLDKVAKECGDRARELRARAEGLRQGAGPEPIAPEVPEGHAPAAELEEAVAGLRAEVRAVVQARAFLAMPMPEPVEPVRPCAEDLARLEGHERARHAALVRLEGLRGELRALPQPRGPDFDPDAAEAAIEHWERWQELQRLRQALAKAAQGTVECLHCGGATPTDPVTVTGLTARIEALGEVPEPLAPPAIARATIAARRHALESAARRAELEREVAWAEDVLPPDRSADLDRMRRYEVALGRYAEEAAAYQDWSLKADRARLTLEIHAGAEEALAAAEAALQAARLHEAQLAAYQKALAKHREAVAAADTASAQAEEWARAKAALAELRVKVKQHLIPSLARVASHLLARMTGGERSSVAIDDEFEIAVDGQPLHTLSGSEKACANLAVRLGLGQVLTRHTFPVLLADEIDASMDEERAAATAACVRGLRDVVGQVILVTHKRAVEADRRVEL